MKNNGPLVRKLSMGLGMVAIDGESFGVASVRIENFSEEALKILKGLDMLTGEWIEDVCHFQDSFTLICNFRDRPDYTKPEWSRLEVTFTYPNKKHFAMLEFPKTKMTVLDMDGYVSCVFETYSSNMGLYGSVVRGIR